MNPLDLLGLGGKLLDRVLPDKAANDAAKLEMFRAVQMGEFKQLEADMAAAHDQVGLAAVDAASADKFQSRWRPFVGWICGVGLLYAVFLDPLIRWGCALWKPGVVPPVIDVSVLVTMLLGMLGLGGMRTMEKIQGAAK